MKPIFWGRDGKGEFLHVFIISPIPELLKVAFHQPVKEKAFPQACRVILYTSHGEALSSGRGDTFV